MGIVIAIPILFMLLLLQTTLARQITLLSGSADLVLLWLAAWGLQKQVKSTWIWTGLAAVVVAYVSSVPWYVPIIGYTTVTILTHFVNRHVWQSPILMMFLVTILGSIWIYLLTFIALTVKGISLPLDTSVVQVVIPSILINLLLSLPIFAIAKDTAQWVYPLEENE